MKKEKIDKEIIFEILKKIRDRNEEEGIRKGAFLIYCNPIHIARLGFIALGKQEKEELDIVGNIYTKDAIKKLRNFCEEGAIIIDKKGNIYFPPIYVNVNLNKLDKKSIKPEYCARHIAALYVSMATPSTTFALSESRGIITEFEEGKIIKEDYPKDFDKNEQ